MAKQSGANGDVLIGSSVNVSDANYSASYVTVDTATAHGLTAGQVVEIASVVGMTDLNGYWVVNSVTDADTFKVELTTAQSYTSGGTVQRKLPCARWTIEKTEAAIDVTDSTHAGARQRIAKGISDYSGTIESFIESGQAPGNNVGESLSLKLYQDTGHYWSGTGIITGTPVSVDVEGEAVNSVTFNWSGNGAWTETS